MKIEKQVCTLPQAKKLAELGITNKDADYCFVSFSVESGQEFVLCRPASSVEEGSKEWAWFMLGEYSEEIEYCLDEESVCADGPVYPAFTVRELAVMVMQLENKKFKNSKSYCGKWPEDKIDIYNPEFLADILIDALEQKAITPEETNAKLLSA